DSGLSSNTQYFYRVRAVNFAGTSDYSSEIGVTTISDSVAAPLGDLLVWLKADSRGWTNGTPVSVWPDLSDARNDAAQATAAGRPLVVTNDMNGKPALRFDGTNDSMGFPDFFRSQTQAEFFVVWKAKDDVPATTKGGMYFGCF